ncbi:hypothetical protein [Kribbella jiaozuonensis]|uniref:Uncharacterized protein n=1 Tax=Kribbella jiaozuonensis TaxID=2575441 RepID=A0A4U3LWJ8_9ACTN|nr:hypothetical protein [Kribbella jiaozuonensis]TKK79206.1 hypothetical protein FDA38_12310 [Kribbella jiaozuonensis]TKK83276.1 hypothetical protein FDA38_11265 [Kribbella jiaozuonensis]
MNHQITISISDDMLEALAELLGDSLVIPSRKRVMGLTQRERELWVLLKKHADPSGLVSGLTTNQMGHAMDQHPGPIWNRLKSMEAKGFLQVMQHTGGKRVNSYQLDMTKLRKPKPLKKRHLKAI